MHDWVVVDETHLFMADALAEYPWTSEVRDAIAQQIRGKGQMVLEATNAGGPSGFRRYFLNGKLPPAP